MAKRSAQGAGNIRQRKNGLWEARYTAGRDPGTGRQVQKSLYGATQKEVLEKLRKVQTSIDNGSFIEPSKLTVANWLDIWHKEYCCGLKPRTLKLYDGYINYRLKPALGAVKLQQLKSPQVQSYYNSLSLELSPKTIKNLHGLLHKAFQKAVEIGYLVANPTVACSLPRIEKPQIKPLDEVQIAEFLKAIKGNRYESLYITSLFTGLRQGEVMGLTWDCVDFTAGTMCVYRQLQRINGEYQFVSLKNDKARTITIANSIIEVLQNQKDRQNEWKEKASSVWEDSGLVFTDEIGGHLVRETLYRDFKKLVLELGYNVRFHDLRHSYAVISLASGDDIKTVQENLGHHTAAFTLDTYAHATAKMKKESAARLDAFIKEVKM